MSEFSTLHTSPHEVIVSALKVIQTQGGEGNFVIFEADETRNYYIQFAGEKGSLDLYAEVVANHLLKPKYQLGASEIGALDALGWKDQGSEMNFTQNFTAADDRERLAIAETVWQTFDQVYGIPIGSELDIKVNLE